MKQELARSILFTALVVTLIFFSKPAAAQQPKCDTHCVETVRDLLRMSYDGFHTSFADGANMRLGDSVGVAIRKIYPGRKLLVADNIRTFLPVIEKAFESPGMIENPAERSPVYSLALLRSLRSRIKDHFLHVEINATINKITPPIYEQPTKSVKP